MRKNQNLVLKFEKKCSFIIYIVVLINNINISVTVSLVKSELNNIPNEKINNGKILKDKNAIFGTPASEVEKSVKSFVLTLIDPLEKSLLHDFRKTSFKRNFQKTVNIYTQIVVENIRGFRRKLTIFKNNNSGEKKVAIPNGNDTLTNLLENGLTVATEFTNFIIEANEISTKFLLGKQQSPLSKSGSLQIMDFLIFTSDFFVYVDCAIKDRNIGKSIKYLYSHSPDKVVEYLEKKIKTPPKNRLFNATESICYSIDKIISGGYKKCIHDLNNVYSCIQHQIPIKSTQNDSESYKILKSLQQSFSKDWMKSVRVLEPRCKIQEVRFDCDFGKKSKSTKNQVREMVEIFIGRKIESGSSLSKIVKRFSKVISKHHVTKNLVRNFYDYIAIWRGGQKKKSMLRNVSKKNSGLLKKLEKVTKSLDNYKKGVVEQLLSSIAAFNQIPTYLEKSLKKAVSKQSNQTLFGSILIYLARLLRAIFDRNSHKSSVSFDYHKNYSNELIVIQEGKFTNYYFILKFILVIYLEFRIQFRI